MALGEPEAAAGRQGGHPLGNEKTQPRPVAGYCAARAFGAARTGAYGVLFSAGWGSMMRTLGIRAMGATSTSFSPTNDPR